jgi:hypothetical protein
LIVDRLDLARLGAGVEAQEVNDNARALLLGCGPLDIFGSPELPCKRKNPAVPKRLNLVISSLSNGVRKVP